MEQRRLYNWLDMLTVVIRLGLGCLFVWSSLSKIQLPHDFLGHVYAYRLAGPVSGMFVALVLPWLELLVGTCLLGGIFVTGALLACMGMAFVFAVAISWVLYHGFNISCGCFGSDATPIGYGTLIRAIAIFVVAGIAYVVELSAQRPAAILPSWWPRGSNLGRALSAGTQDGDKTVMAGQVDSA
jgi:uncharacterized membrane protein YphA (DoxX/SURF4 family)